MKSARLYENKSKNLRVGVLFVSMSETRLKEKIDINLKNIYGNGEHNLLTANKISSSNVCNMLLMRPRNYDILARLGDRLTQINKTREER